MKQSLNYFQESCRAKKLKDPENDAETFGLTEELLQGRDSVDNPKNDAQAGCLCELEEKLREARKEGGRVENEGERVGKVAARGGMYLG